MIPNPFERVANKDGTPRLCESKCSSCLFNPGAMTNGMRAVIDDARQRESFILCHETYKHSTFVPAPGVQPAMCRGYYDANAATQYGLQIVKRYKWYEEVPVPPPDPDKRAYRLVSDAGGEFLVERNGRPL